MVQAVQKLEFVLVEKHGGKSSPRERKKRSLLRRCSLP